MNQKEYELIAGALHRTGIVASMEKNKIKREAKQDILRLVAIDLAANMQHYYTSFDRNKFMESCYLK